MARGRPQNYNGSEEDTAALLSLRDAATPGGPRYKFLQGRMLEGASAALGADKGKAFFEGVMRENPAKFLDFLKAFIPVSRQSESVNANVSARPNPAAVAADLAGRLGIASAHDAPALDVDATPADASPVQASPRPDSLEELAAMYA